MPVHTTTSCAWRFNPARPFATPATRRLPVQAASAPARRQQASRPAAAVLHATMPVSVASVETYRRQICSVPPPKRVHHPPAHTGAPVCVSPTGGGQSSCNRPAPAGVKTGLSALIQTYPDTEEPLVPGGQPRSIAAVNRGGWVGVAASACRCFGEAARAWGHHLWCACCPISCCRLLPFACCAPTRQSRLHGTRARPQPGELLARCHCC
jgi:hypothetical protein